jgi:hypothetical protein
MPGGMMLPDRNMSTAAAMLGGNGVPFCYTPVTLGGQVNLIVASLGHGNPTCVYLLIAGSCGFVLPVCSCFKSCQDISLQENFLVPCI